MSGRRFLVRTPATRASFRTSAVTTVRSNDGRTQCADGEVGGRLYAEDVGSQVNSSVAPTLGGSKTHLFN